MNKVFIKKEGQGPTGKKTGSVWSLQEEIFRQESRKFKHIQRSHTELLLTHSIIRSSKDSVPKNFLFFSFDEEILFI